jgi:prepilin-type N-terminal cleavage/methylation domain-containing protein
MKDTCAKHKRSGDGGFSLLEMIVVIAIILVLAAMTIPRVMTQVYSIRIQYSATDLSGLLQRARMEAVRKNSFYSVQYVGGNPAMEQIVDKTLAVPVPAIPPAVLASSVTAVYGTGSGAPGEAAFVAALNFPTGVAAAATGLPSFNARGLPCVRISATICQQFTGQGFVFFLSGTSAAGAVGWSAVAVTPSGRCEVFSYDGTNWNQR